MGSKKIHEEEGRRRQKLEVEGRKKKRKEESKQINIIWLLVPDPGLNSAAFDHLREGLQVTSAVSKYLGHGVSSCYSQWQNSGCIGQRCGKIKRMQETHWEGLWHLYLLCGR